MTHSESVRYIRGAISHRGGIWADLGAGSGTFTFAIAELIGPDGSVYAVDSKGPKLNVPPEVAPSAIGKIIPIQADFTQPFSLPPLDGILMGNSLHYVSDKLPLLKILSRHLKPGGQLILIEYDTLYGNPWVPYPIDFPSWQQLAPNAGFSKPILVSHITSRYQSKGIFVALSHKT